MNIWDVKLYDEHSTLDLPQTKVHLEELIRFLEEIKIKLKDYDKYKTDLDTANDYKTISSALQAVGVTLTMSEGLTEEDWNEDRLQQALQAIKDIIIGLARFIFDNVEAELFGLIQFMLTFNGTTIQLTKGSFDGSQSYASTSTDGKVIYLYTAPSVLLQTDLQRCAEGLREDINDTSKVNAETCAAAGYTLHSARNIVHEFGHALAFKSAGMASEWDNLRKLLSYQISNGNSGFETGWGWGTVFEQFENRATYKENNFISPNDPKYMTATEIENERLANMFQAAIYDYELQPMNSDSHESRAAVLIWIFMTGECPSDDILKIVFANRSYPPCGDKVIGLREWILKFEG